MMNYFKLPDLGEGLQEAEIIEWHISDGDEVKQDQPLASVETAKAIVDLPSPQDGKILKLYGKAGDIIHVGDPLVEFETETASESDTGTVVGKVEIGDSVVTEIPIASSYPSTTGFKATPAVRALASRLKVDLAMVKPSGRDNIITADDVQRVAKLIKKAGECSEIGQGYGTTTHFFRRNRAVPDGFLDRLQTARFRLKSSRKY